MNGLLTVFPFISEYPLQYFLDNSLGMAPVHFVDPSETVPCMEIIKFLWADDKKVMQIFDVTRFSSDTFHLSQI